MQEKKLLNEENNNQEVDAHSVNPTTRNQLKAFIERVERLEEEKAAIAADIKEVYAEAKSCGYDTKALRTIVTMRKKDVEELSEQQAILDTYLVALGMAD